MVDLPIPFSGPMVRALLAGRKTQTRRVTPQPPPECSINYMIGNESWLPPEQRTQIRRTFEAWGGDLYKNRPEKALCGSFEIVPRYQIGDRLYVREHWRVSKRWDDTSPRDLEPRKMSIVMEAGGSICNEGDPLRWIPSDWPHGERPDWIGRFRQGMHMPRWASRITLTVTDVRVERLQEISEEDAIAEGIERVGDWWRDYRFAVGAGPSMPDPVASYRTLWNSINGPGAWDANPWVAAYTFSAALGNIDHQRRT